MPSLHSEYELILSQEKANRTKRTGLFTELNNSIKTIMNTTEIKFNACPKPHRIFTDEIPEHENHTQIIGDTNMDYIGSDEHSLFDFNSSKMIEVSLYYAQVYEPGVSASPSLFLLSPPGTDAFSIQQKAA